MALESCDSTSLFVYILSFSTRSFERVRRIYASYTSDLAMDSSGESRSTHLPRGLPNDTFLRRIVQHQLVDQTGRFPGTASAPDERPGITMFDDLDFLRRCIEREFGVRAVRQKTVHDRLRDLEEFICHRVSTETLRAGYRAERTIVFKLSPVVHRD